MYSAVQVNVAENSADLNLSVMVYLVFDHFPRNCFGKGAE